MLGGREFAVLYASDSFRLLIEVKEKVKLMKLSLSCGDLIIIIQLKISKVRANERILLENLNMIIQPVRKTINSFVCLSLFIQCFCSRKQKKINSYARLGG